MGFLLQVLLFNPVPGFRQCLNADTSPFSGIQKFEPAVPVIITIVRVLKYYALRGCYFRSRSDVSEDCNEYFYTFIHEYDISADWERLRYDQSAYLICLLFSQHR